MELQFLGTSAGEQYPGIWCHCENCEKARRLGGKNIRQNACLYIKPNYLIDLPPEIVTQARKYNLELSQIEHLLITHSHKDHFFPYLLQWRYCRDKKMFPKLTDIGPRFSKLKTLHIYGNKEVCKLVGNELFDDIDKFALKLHIVKPFKEFRMGEMSVVPVLANHSAASGEKALNYIVSDGKITLFYGLDSGWFLPKSFDVIRQFKYDLVVIEGTFGLGHGHKKHFNFRLVKKCYALFREEGLLKKRARFVATHFSPHHTPVHSEVVSIFKGEGITAVYDGLKLDLKHAERRNEIERDKC